MENEFWKDSVIHKSAQIGYDVFIGPFSHIGPNVKIGNGVRIEGFSAIGTRPEHRSHWNEDSVKGVEIGYKCVIREFTTINSGVARTTKLGDKVVLLRGAHIGHDAIVEDEANIACNVLVGGHCYIGKGANIGLGAAIHQHRAIGARSMVGMGAVVTKDILPFTKWFGNPAVYQGLNEIGCARAMVDVDTIKIFYESILGMNGGKFSFNPTQKQIDKLFKEERDMFTAWMENCVEK